MSAHRCPSCGFYFPPEKEAPAKHTAKAPRKAETRTELPVALVDGDGTTLALEPTAELAERALWGQLRAHYGGAGWTCKGPRNGPFVATGRPITVRPLSVTLRLVRSDGKVLLKTTHNIVTAPPTEAQYVERVGIDADRIASLMHGQPIPVGVSS